MPTLNDIPITPAIVTIAATDRIPIYDISLQPHGERTITIEALFEGYLASLPTSASGLSTGDLWMNSGVLTRVTA